MADILQMHDLKPAPGANKDRIRVGRGEGSKGKTSGRGAKGQTKRNHVRPGFEGGQMPLYRRIPKSGFTNIFAKEFATINLSELERFEDGTTVTVALLKQHGLVKQIKDGVKGLGGGELTKKLTVQVDRFTASAKEKIEALGGKAEVI